MNVWRAISHHFQKGSLRVSRLSYSRLILTLRTTRGRGSSLNLPNQTQGAKTSRTDCRLPHIEMSATTLLGLIGNRRITNAHRLMDGGSIPPSSTDKCWRLLPPTLGMFPQFSNGPSSARMLVEKRPDGATRIKVHVRLANQGRRSSHRGLVTHPRVARSSNCHQLDTRSLFAARPHEVLDFLVGRHRAVARIGDAVKLH